MLLLSSVVRVAAAPLLFTGFFDNFFLSQTNIEDFCCFLLAKLKLLFLMCGLSLMAFSCLVELDYA